MGLYRANFNLPVLRFSKTALLDDSDPHVIAWVKSGALVRLDDAIDPQTPNAVPPAAADEVSEVPAPKVAAESKPRKRTTKATKATGARRKSAPQSSGLNPDLGIRFDE